ncbi:MAG: winged helix-turn-helix domain-containing protein [Devosia sp.]|nr:winged helix-turn-helix domain-containing protein [Devosia sp.]
MRVLVVEDDVNLNRQLKEALTEAGYVVDIALDGEEGHYLGDTEPYDAVVLDIGLPQMDGLSVLEAWRRTGKIMPVLLLTARDRWSDKVQGIDAGADDYVAKPFSPRELVARVGAVLRRVRPALAGETLVFADIEMDTVAHKVRRGGKPVALGPTEFRLLRHLLEHPGRVFSRERLLDSVWGHDSDIELRTVDVHIRRLRKAINQGDRPDLIRTVRSAGYSLDAEGA